MLNFFTLLSFIGFVVSIVHGTRIQVPLNGEYFEDYNRWGVNLNFNLSIGTPSQQWPFTIQTNDPTKDFILPDSRFNPDGFDGNKSSTFQEEGDLFFEDSLVGINGTDTITFPDGTILKKKPVQLLNYDLLGRRMYGFFGVHRFLPSDGKDCIGCTTFVESVLQGYEDKFLTFAFNKIHPNQQDFAGEMVFGEKPNEWCKPKWSVFDEVKEDKPFWDLNKQWNVKLDKVTLSKYTFQKPTVLFSLRETIVQLSSDLQTAVLKVLGVQDSNNIPCDSKIAISFFYGNNVINITENEIIEKNPQRGNCYFQTPSGDLTVLPISVLSAKCLYFDYANAQVGITERV